jgi:hypothetical protein
LLFFGGSINTDVVMPAGPALPALSVPLPHSAPCTGRNLRTGYANNVIVTFLFEGLAWYAAIICRHKSMVGLLRRAHRLQVITVFVDLAFLALVSLSFLLFFFLVVLFMVFAHVGISQLFCVVSILI